MNQSENKVSPRLSVLELSQALGNISDSCRQSGMSCSQFNEYKQRFQSSRTRGFKRYSVIYTQNHIPDHTNSNR